MKRIIYSILVICIALGISSCENENSLPTLMGNWDYQKPYFEFDYATDSISLAMNQDKKISISVSDLKGMVMGLAGSKMATYFQGIEFTMDNQLYILFQTSESVSMKLQASYVLSDDLMQLSLNKSQMEELMGKMAANIPAISLKYYLENEKMTLWLDEVYLQVVYSMMEDNLMPVIIRQFVPAYDRMPEPVQEKMKEAFKSQLRAVFDNIIQLKFGFVLNRK